MLQSLFADKNGTPKIRYKGFVVKWNKKQLQEIGRFFGGLTGKNKEDFGHGKGRYITYMNVYKNTIADDSMCETVDVASGERQNIVLNGDILFTQSSETIEEIGLASVWLQKTEPYLNSFCFGFRLSDPNIDSLWFAYLMRSPTMRRRIMREGQGITRVNLSSERLKAVYLNLPSYDEQKKISSLLFLVDSRIATEEEKLSKLTKMKSGLLQQLFV